MDKMKLDPATCYSLMTPKYILDLGTAEKRYFSPQDSLFFLGKFKYSNTEPMEGGLLQETIYFENESLSVYHDAKQCLVEVDCVTKKPKKPLSKNENIAVKLPFLDEEERKAAEMQSQMVAPPQAYGYPPQGYGYPPQGYAYPPQGYGYPPQGYMYPPQAYGYPPQGYGYPPQGYMYPPQGYGYPPRGGNKKGKKTKRSTLKKRQTRRRKH